MRQGDGRRSAASRATAIARPRKGWHIAPSQEKGGWLTQPPSNIT